VRRRLAWRFEEDGSLSGTFRLPPLAGAVLLKALRAACADLAPPPGGPRGDVSAETPAAPGRVPGDPARCHFEDGPAISVSTAQMLGCTAALTWMAHGDAGAVLALGQRRRRPSSAIRRAARERDHGRCRFPGCESRRADLHHIMHWVNGGRTDLANLISLCSWHHQIVHDRGYTIAVPPGGGFAFYRLDGTLLPGCPPLPEPDGPIGQAHDADITPNTIIPPWYGERLDLNHAIWTCFANARIREEREHDHDGDPADRGRVTVYEPEDWAERYRQYREHAPRRTGPTPIPIQV
jgi:HNH endonuclease